MLAVGGIDADELVVPGLHARAVALGVVECRARILELAIVRDLVPRALGVAAGRDVHAGEDGVAGLHVRLVEEEDRLDDRVQLRAVGRVREACAAKLLVVDRAAALAARPARAAVARDVEAVVRGAVPPGHIRDDDLPVRTGLDRDVVHQGHPVRNGRVAERGRVEHLVPRALAVGACPEEPRARRGVDVTLSVEGQPADGRAVEGAPADKRPAALVPGLRPEHADAGVVLEGGVRLAGADPDRAVRCDRDRADRERALVVEDRCPAPAAVGGPPDAPVGAARVDRVTGDREGAHAAGDQSRASAGVRDERVPVARGVGVVRLARDLGPRAAHGAQGGLLLVRRRERRGAQRGARRDPRGRVLEARATDLVGVRVGVRRLQQRAFGRPRRRIGEANDRERQERDDGEEHGERERASTGHRPSPQAGNRLLNLR